MNPKLQVQSKNPGASPKIQGGGLYNYLTNCRFHTSVEEPILGWKKVILSLRGHLKTKLETIIL